MSNDSSDTNLDESSLLRSDFLEKLELRLSSRLLESVLVSFTTILRSNFGYSARNESVTR